MTSRSLRTLSTCLLPVLLIAACGDDDDDSGEPDSTEAPASGDDDPVTVATFEVAGSETYKIELATPQLIDHARRLLAGEQVAAIPLGTVVRDDPGVNEPWSWHIDPSTLEFADVTIEVCDGLPSHVEEGVVTSDQYCPWSAVVIAVDEL
jgi:hypothetical protein